MQRMNEITFLFRLLQQQQQQLSLVCIQLGVEERRGACMCGVIVIIAAFEIKYISICLSVRA
jgi:hypothetical protein